MNAEGAEVFCDGECVYKGAVQDTPETVIVHADPVVAEKPKQPEVIEPATERYRLKALMNVRKKLSLDADILSSKPESTVVRVLAVENGWLHLIWWMRCSSLWYQRKITRRHWKSGSRERSSFRTIRTTLHLSPAK